MIKNNILDIFSGCGGLSLGMKDSGFKVSHAIDFDRDSLITYKNNFKGSKIINLDLFNTQKSNDLFNKLKNEIDLIVAGPPCQGFSLTGPRKFNDKRNNLYLSVLNSIDIIKPKAFVIENVPGIINLYDGKIKDQILLRLKKSKYKVSYKILNSADYGVPQIRKRAFFVGVSDNYDLFKFPKPKFDTSNYISSKMALSDLDPLQNQTECESYLTKPTNDYQKKMRQKSSKSYNHKKTNHTKEVIDVISQVPPGGNYKDLPENVGTTRNFNEAWTRYHPDKPSRTIDTGHRNHFHYYENRVPTVRENARLQSFPDDFIFFGSKTSQYRQVGNAVPVILAKSIGKELSRILL